MAADEAYLVWTVRPESGRGEIVLAELTDLGFEAFEEDGDGLKAFIPERLASERVRERMREHVGSLADEILGPLRVEPENWNRAWESTVKPVHAGRFVIHPPWEEPPDGPIAIRIEPKMSFGTGYHESTRLMLQLVSDLVHSGDRVLDAGTGTGVLAIAAVLLGADSATGFDVDPWSSVNARENVRANGLEDRIAIVEGEMDEVPGGTFDVVLANINRNVLLDLMPGFEARIAPGGRLGLSGILVEDRDVMVHGLEAAGFRLRDELTEGQWLALGAERT